MNYAPTSERLRFACVGSYVPRQCGIATFSHDLCNAICQQVEDQRSCQVIALNDLAEGYAYPHRVRFEVRQGQLPDYRLAADFINIRNLDLVLLQHEYGILGGEDGSHVLALLRDLTMPVVTTMHTVLCHPTERQRRITAQLVDLSDRVVVMAQRAVELLQEVYNVPPEKVLMIPHGIPDVPFVDPAYYKDQFGIEGRKVILTFGLLSPGKGIENVIKALPEVVVDHPDLIYIVLGATHPHIRKTRGEEYRHELQHLAEDLGVLGHVMFENRYVELEELCEFLGAADIYLTPYLGEEQIVSGTLAYALGAGKAVISTPYWYAREMLADGRGRLVPFQDPEAIAEAICGLLDNEIARQAMRKKAYLFMRQAVWQEVAGAYLELFREVRTWPSVRRPRIQQKALASPKSVLRALPELKINHVRTLTDGVGMLQHSRYTIPDRDHGYCTDDNARALIFALRAHRLTNSAELLEMARTYLSFLQHAYSAQTGRFRNFLSYDRRWLEKVGSEDCHGRALWGLGNAVADAPSVGLRAAATELFDRSLPATEQFTWPRAWAFTVVGIHAYLRHYSGDSEARRIRETLSERLFRSFCEHATDDWVWPEEQVTYANGKLPHALLLAGQWMQRGEMVEMGLRSLRWLMQIQTAPGGTISPIGNSGWYRKGKRKRKARFDQQPIEIHALLEACIEAYNATGDDHWVVEARRCFDWFLGRNPLNKPLYDYETGGCRDGLQRSGVNENEGAESTLAWLLSLLAIRSLEPERGQVRVPEVPAEAAAAGA